MKITGIKMKNGCEHSNTLTEIDKLLIEDNNGSKFYSKESVHNYLKENPGSIYVNISPYPDAQPATSSYGEKYVRSEANNYLYDNILMLPRY